jgi:hypothetical protein
MIAVVPRKQPAGRRVRDPPTFAARDCPSSTMEDALDRYLLLSTATAPHSSSASTA